jgi:hypothetical protein
VKSRRSDLYYDLEIFPGTRNMRSTFSLRGCLSGPPPDVSRVNYRGDITIVPETWTKSLLTADRFDFFFGQIIVTCC